MSEGPSVEMPRYQCHKKVWALKIAEIGHFGDHSTIVPADEGYGEIDVEAAWIAKHNPQPGGYYVVYADGYKSFSPAKAFEEGYTRI